MRNGATIVRLRKKYTRLRALETILFAGGMGSLLWAIGWWIHVDPLLVAILATAVATAIAVFRIRQLGLPSMNNERMSYFLNRAFPQLQDSSDLLLRPQDQLSPLEEIQVLRTERALDALDYIKLPNYAPLAMIVFALGIIVAISSNLLLTGTSPSAMQVSGNRQTGEQFAAVPESSKLDGYSLTIDPPGYTGIRKSSIEHLSTTVPEGSVLTWLLSFTTSPGIVRLQFSNGDSIALTKHDGQYKLTRRVTESIIYQLKWESLGVTRSSDYFEIRVKPDGVPALNITGLQQFTRLGWNERTFVDVPVVMSDDYGLSRGYIIATVSKGSGESIKFREEKLSFDSPTSVSGKHVNARRRIEFRKLGMEPGDEIYFYAEAWDNKQPDYQRARTETFFVSLQDTASTAIMTDASLGVDLMPDYFRSQRQIIIDTEKLLKDQPKISLQQFKSTSNELGYDQKVLRLKYGQFLGEEFETNIGASAHRDAEEKGSDEDPLKQFGHQHDKENEHNLVPDKKPEAGHQHEDEEDEKDPTAAFKHNHDNMEEATFFTQSVRSKLKAALTMMWDAELQLRLYAPKESLPIQYKILNLLKEISQDSRIYVHRMGFDPPPLKEEKRLTGDLSEIANKEAEGVAGRDKLYPAIRKALVSINDALQTSMTIPDEQLKADLQVAASEIAAFSIARPGSYLVQLSMIRSIIDGTLNESEYTPALLEIRSACWKILPYEDPGPGQLPNTRHPLDADLLDELNRHSNE